MIDAHVHFWRLSRGVNTALTECMAPIYRDLEPKHLEPVIGRHRMEGVIVVQASETLGETLYMLGLVERFDWISGVVSWLDPGSASLTEEIAGLCRDSKVRGVRPVRNDNRSIRWMTDPGLRPGWSALANSPLVVEILVQDWRELDLVHDLLLRHPEGQFVLDHCGKPDVVADHFDGWARSIEALARHENLACKYSGLSQVADVERIFPFSRHVIECFGPERLMWASDWPPLELKSSYDTWIAQTETLLGDQSKHARSAIRRDTTARMYGLR